MATSRNLVPKGRKIFYVLAILVITAIGIVLIANQLAINADRARFVNAEKTKAAIVTQLVQYLGNNAQSTKEQNQCFNSEQGPYDSGKLWCQTATVITLGASPKFANVGRQFAIEAGAYEKKVNSSGEGTTLRFWYQEEGMFCSLGMIDDNAKELGSSTKDVLSANSSPAISISCADRARAAYYPFAK